MDHRPGQVTTGGPGGAPGDGPPTLPDGAPWNPAIPLPSDIGIRSDAPRAAAPGLIRRRRRSRRGRPGGRPRLRDRRWFRVCALLLALFLVWFSWSFGRAMTAPGGGSLAERAAEWARDHYLGPLVTFGEWITYQPPKTGGKPSFSLAVPGHQGTGHHGQGRAGRRPGKGAGPAAGYGPPARLASPAGKPLPGEGQWRVLYRVHRYPAIYGTYLRPDRVHTSYVAGVVSMDPRLLRFELHPGAQDPGPGRYGGAQPVIGPGARRGLAATFNGGFKIASAAGGFYLNGTTKGALRPGAATMVYYRDGRLAIGLWGHGLRMTPAVAGVRQNLRPIVWDGAIPRSVNQNVLSSWGATLGGGYYVWRSGVGVTARGRIIFVYGPALDVRTLAGLLKRAGAVTAMQLDINPEWTDFTYYRPAGHPADPRPVPLLPGQYQPAARYYSVADRDFTAVYAR